MDTVLSRKLETLRLYLSNLPDFLPYPERGLSVYNFELLEVSEEDYGETGVINRQLEIAFGSRRNGPVVFVERGPGLASIVNVLRAHLLKDPTSAILQNSIFLSVEFRCVILDEGPYSR
ncbi:hypothetical protein JVU11DRAFT_11687 [Chiua virens]|nr:hypothetical protein JVU11DRAFT_11687 [Chiua virens]